VTDSAASRSRIPALLIIGAMGTGKSDTSYHVFSRLYRSGTPTARLDLDDVGMSHPSPADDPDNFKVKAASMAACWEVFRAHGATCFVVSGGLDSPGLIDLHTSQLPEADWTIVRLRIGSEERRRRVLRRGLLLGYSEIEMEPTVAAGDADEAHVASVPLPGTVIDTDGLTSQQVVDRILDSTGWPSRPHR
jgi:hypothetical protein